jgi:hypothetical protein
MEALPLTSQDGDAVSPGLNRRDLLTRGGALLALTLFPLHAVDAAAASPGLVGFDSDSAASYADVCAVLATSGSTPIVLGRIDEAVKWLENAYESRDEEYRASVDRALAAARDWVRRCPPSLDVGDRLADLQRQIGQGLPVRDTQKRRATGALGPSLADNCDRPRWIPAGKPQYRTADLPPLSPIATLPRGAAELPPSVERDAEGLALMDLLGLAVRPFAPSLDGGPPPNVDVMRL